jgi:ABC-type uncharacterized transport system permease subunit
MDATLVLISSLLYLLATVVYGTYLLRFENRYVNVAAVFLGFGAIVNLWASVHRLTNDLATFAAYDILLAVAGLTVVIFVVLLFRKPMPLVGAFLAPIATMVLYSLHVFGREAEVARRAVVSVITPIHIGASLVGFVVLVIAAAASALLIVQEYRLKTKKIPLGSGGNLPSLQRLEKISHRALVVGFPIYTIGVVLGAVWFVRGEGAGVTRHLIMAVFSWCVYAIALHARIVVGWKGRRAAIVTLVAFASALFVVFLSILRSGG